MCENKARYHHRVITKGVELRVGEAENDGESGAANVPQQEGVEGRNIPVPPAADDNVEIAAQLVSL